MSKAEERADLIEKVCTEILGKVDFEDDTITRERKDAIIEKACDKYAVSEKHIRKILEMPKRKRH